MQAPGVVPSPVVAGYGKECRTIRFYRFLVFIPLGLWVVLIFSWSSQPYEEQSIRPFLREHFDQEQVREWMPDVKIHYRTSTIHAQTAPFHFIEFIFRKSAHLFVYAVLAILSYMALLPGRMRWGWKCLAILLFVAVIALLDEWNQSVTPQRTSAIQDVGIDLIGASFGLVLAGLFRYLNKR